MSQRQRDADRYFATGCIAPVVIAFIAAYGVDALFHGDVLTALTFFVVLAVGLKVGAEEADEQEYQDYARRRDHQAAQKARYDRERRNR
jgi:hypothetical protein